MSWFDVSCEKAKWKYSNMYRSQGFKLCDQAWTLSYAYHRGGSCKLPNAKCFSKLDAESGFWQIELDEPSSKLLTFNTPFGRYKFLRFAFGISSSPEIFQRAMSQLIEDIEGVECIVDDILVWGETMEQHDQRLRHVLERVRENNLKSNSTLVNVYVGLPVAT